MNTERIIRVLGMIFLTISAIAILANHKIESDFAVVGIPILIGAIFWILSIIFGLIHWIKFSALNTPNPIETMKFYYRYFTGVGYGLFTGGIVTLVTTNSTWNSYFLIILGLTFMSTGELYGKKHRQFKELISGR